MSSDEKDARWQMATDLGMIYDIPFPVHNHFQDGKLLDIGQKLINLSTIRSRLIKQLATRWQHEEQEEPMPKTPTPTPPVEVRWSTAITDPGARELVGSHRIDLDLEEGKTVADLAQDYQVRQVKEMLRQFDEEIIRLDELKQQVISTKKQLKAAVFNND